MWRWRSTRRRARRVGHAIRRAVPRKPARAARAGAARRAARRGRSPDHGQRRRADATASTARPASRSGRATCWRDRPMPLRACGYSTSPLVYKNTDHHDRRRYRARRDRARRATGHDRVAGPGFRERILVAVAHRSGRPARAGRLHVGRDRRPRSGDGRTRMEPSPRRGVGVNVATPIWGDDHLLFVSSAYDGGSRVLKLARTGDRVSVEEVWANQRVRIHFGNAVRLGGRLYASNGDIGSAPFAAIDITTGEMALARSQRDARDARRRRQPTWSCSTRTATWHSRRRATRGSTCTRRSRFSRARVDGAHAQRHDAVRPRTATTSWRSTSARTARTLQSCTGRWSAQPGLSCPSPTRR